MGLYKFAPYLGLVLIIASVPLIASGVYGSVNYVFYGEPKEGGSTLVLYFGVSYALVGFLLSRVRARGVLSMGDAVLFTALIWLFVPILSAAPISLFLGIPYLDALFESVAGWTTTGLTIFLGEESSSGGYVPSIEELPESVKVWRSTLQWIGGVGIVIFTIAFLAAPGVSVAYLYLAEGRYERLEASLKRSARQITVLYFVVTAFAIALFYAAGMPLKDSIHHAMTAVSTAGFSIRDESIGYYGDNLAIYASALLASFLGAMSFSDLNNLVTARVGRLLGSPEFRAQLFLLGLTVLLAYVIWNSSEGMRKVYTLEESVFNALSSFITVGYSVEDLKESSDQYKVALAILGLIGGSAFSTAGGFKVLRLLIAVKILWMEATIIIKPRGYVAKPRIGGRELSEALLRRTFATLTAFLVSLVILTMLLLIPYEDYYRSKGLSTIDVLFESVSSIANIGLSTGVTSPSAPEGVKILLIAGMLLGRLEILVFIVALKHFLSTVLK